MKWLRVGVGGFCVLIAVPVLVTYVQDGLPEDIELSVMLSLLAIIAVYAIWCSNLVPNAGLRLTRGVTAVASDRSRRAQFSKPWGRARHSIRAWGVGMTSLARDVDVITATVASGVKVVLEITDGAWVRAHPDVMAIVDSTYGRSNFVDQIEDSTVRLVSLAQRLNHEHGANSMEVWAVEAYIPQSGTVADPESVRAWGWVEWHTFGFPHGQLRLRMRLYKSRSPLNPPLLRHLLLARDAVPRRRIDTVPTEPQRSIASGPAAAPAP